MGRGSHFFQTGFSWWYFNFDGLNVHPSPANPPLLFSSSPPLLFSSPPPLPLSSSSHLLPPPKLAAESFPPLAASLRFELLRVCQAPEERLSAARPTIRPSFRPPVFPSSDLRAGCRLRPWRLSSPAFIPLISQFTAGELMNKCAQPPTVCPCREDTPFRPAGATQRHRFPTEAHFGETQINLKQKICYRAL